MGYKLFLCDICDGLEIKTLGTLSSNSSGQLDVLWHDGDTLGMDGTQVGVFKKTNQVGFTGFLQNKQQYINSDKYSNH